MAPLTSPPAHSDGTPEEPKFTRKEFLAACATAGGCYLMYRILNYGNRDAAVEAIESGRFATPMPPIDNLEELNKIDDVDALREALHALEEFSPLASAETESGEHLFVLMRNAVGEERLVQAYERYLRQRPDGELI